jgi:hypothetical protein
MFRPRERAPRRWRVAILTACAPYQIHTDYDREASFSWMGRSPDGFHAAKGRSISKPPLSAA